jgi:hypothetical protein
LEAKGQAPPWAVTNLDDGETFIVGQWLILAMISSPAVISVGADLGSLGITRDTCCVLPGRVDNVPDFQSALIRLHRRRDHLRGFSACRYLASRLLPNDRGDARIPDLLTFPQQALSSTRNGRAHALHCFDAPPANATTP